MKANEFVKKYGIEAAIDLWCGAFDLYNNNLQILNGMVCSFPGNQFLFDLVDIKRIVKSHELVESFGGLKMAKESLKNLPSEYQSYTMTRDDTGATTQSFKLNQAIFDVESCQ